MASMMKLIILVLLFIFSSSFEDDDDDPVGSDIFGLSNYSTSLELTMMSIRLMVLVIIMRINVSTI